MARARVGVAHIPEQGFGSGALIIEKEVRPKCRQMLRHRTHIGFRLLGNAGERCAFGFRLDHPSYSSIDNQQVVARSGRQRVLADRNPKSCPEVHMVAVLHNPPSSLEKLVDALPRFSFRHRHQCMAPPGIC
jgi:hypothetical protein